MVEPFEPEKVTRDYKIIKNPILLQARLFCAHGPPCFTPSLDHRQHRLESPEPGSDPALGFHYVIRQGRGELCPGTGPGCLFPRTAHPFNFCEFPESAVFHGTAAEPERVNPTRRQHMIPSLVPPWPREMDLAASIHGFFPGDNRAAAAPAEKKSARDEGFSPVAREDPGRCPGYPTPEYGLWQAD